MSERHGAVDRGVIWGLSAVLRSGYDGDDVALNIFLAQGAG